MALLLLIRHGVTASTGRRLPDPEAPLSEEGMEQARGLAGRLDGVPIAAVYSSPLARCRQTADPLARSIGLPVRVRPDLTDVGYGRWAGRSIAQVRKTKLWRVVETTPLAVRFPEGESLLEVYRRAVGAVHDIAEAHPRAVVAVVTHADVIRLALAHLAGAPPDMFGRLVVDPASLSVAVLGDGVPRVLRVNDTGTLAELAPGRARRNLRG